MTTEELKTFISQKIPEAVFEETQFLNVIIDATHLRNLALALHDDASTDFDYLFCLSGVDWKDFFYVVYHLTSRNHKHTVVLKSKITDRINPEIETVSDLWKTAEFHEREVFDLFGIKFINHPDLRRLFLDDSWGFPLRKDYKDDVTIVSL
ncbi:MAG: NADH-quinone oxidoreductase subunit C [Chitinophagales bacterium]|nr:NADH-quinone oxidoreductase subunit C [Chitinophagales bacterium]